VYEYDVVWCRKEGDGRLEKVKNGQRKEGTKERKKGKRKINKPADR
jgi:hypothetical protein